MMVDDSDSMMALALDPGPDSEGHWHAAQLAWHWVRALRNAELLRNPGRLPGRFMGRLLPSTVTASVTYGPGPSRCQ